MSEYYAEKIAGALNLSQQEKNQLFSLAAATSRKKVSSRVLQNDEIAFVTEWENFAILNLMKTEDFVSDVDWIGIRLGVKPQRISQCLDLLTTVGLIQWTGTGFQRSCESVRTTTEIPSKFLRQAHRNELMKAVEVLESVPVKDRSFTSSTMAINPARLLTAKKMIQEFQEKLVDHLSQGEKTEVYNLNLQLFPLTKVRE